MREDKLNNIYRLYYECKDTFGPSNFFDDMTDEISNQEIQLFYRALCDFFLQEQQKKIIDKKNQ